MQECSDMLVEPSLLRSFMQKDVHEMDSGHIIDKLDLHRGHRSCPFYGLQGLNMGPTILPCFHFSSVPDLVQTRAMCIGAVSRHIQHMDFLFPVYLSQTDGEAAIIG